MRNQSWAKPGQVRFRRFASLCVGGVDAAGLQIGTGSVNQGGPRTREQRHLASNSGSRWRMAQGDSTLPRLTKDNQRSSRAALGVESPVVGIRGPLGFQHRRTDCASPRGAYPKRAPHRAAPAKDQCPCYKKDHCNGHGFLAVTLVLDHDGSSLHALRLSALLPISLCCSMFPVNQDVCSSLVYKEGDCDIPCALLLQGGAEMD
ncbi:hypothetical protein NDU88_005390 [Pleurodeles waltl]|uniref:Uncharacterized protein n=1 Tax=Pleurodeles waltl TaxID=8319 RepID=A0AAV7VLC8_PLEWA|nr:hypothetical protein NDU88_005390 [Pleurodeles waltl]